MDIDNIEVLKDADATSIYGSRGANGVILITTKKGKAGKTKIDLNFYSGIGEVTRTMQFMNTQQYLAMRREAYKNDNAVPQPADGPDLLLWDTTKYTNWQKMLIGGTSHSTNAQATLSGGNEQTQFLIGTNYQHETTVFPGDLGDSRADVHLNLNHSSMDKSLSFAVTASYSNDVNNQIQADLFSFTNLPPDAPSPYDASGKLQWSQNGGSFSNPLAYLLQTYVATTDNFIGNTNISYKILPGLLFKVDGGYTYTQLNQVATAPVASQNPLYNPTSYAQFGNNNIKSWIIEPQLTYTRQLGKGTLESLVGVSQQQQVTNGTSTYATNYSNDALIASVSGAGTTTSSSDYSEYRYQAIFARLHYNWDGKYIINLTGRRDGSSRFGPGKQYANFGAAGAAWIFSEERFVKDALPFLSFGKLRSSYGITGNDQIGDYKYLDTWRATTYAYQGTTGLQSFRLYNPDYAWEINKKEEGGIDLGFINDRVLLSVDYFNSRSSNQLVNYTLPTQTGFSGILENLPALVQNAGWEFSLNTVNLDNHAFKWTSSFNLTAAKNKLLDFPGLSNSTYANTYVVGQPLNIVKLFHYTGVDPATGIYQYSGTSNPTDKNIIEDLTPKFYGGLSNTFSYKRFELSFLFQFVKQNGYTFYRQNFNGGTFPGAENNEPVSVLNRWQVPGDVKPIGIYTTGLNAQQFTAITNFAQSDAVVGDASFIRLKNVSFSYKLKERTIKFLKASNAEVYLRGQNLLTITNYFGADPENKNSALPPIKLIVAGIRVTF